MFAIKHKIENRLLGIGCDIVKIDDGVDLVFTLHGKTSVWFSETQEDAEDVVINGGHYDNPWDNAEDRPYHTYKIEDLEVVSVEMAVFPKEEVEVFSLWNGAQSKKSIEK